MDKDSIDDLWASMNEAPTNRSGKNSSILDGSITSNGSSKKLRKKKKKKKSKISKSEHDVGEMNEGNHGENEEKHNFDFQTSTSTVPSDVTIDITQLSPLELIQSLKKEFNSITADSIPVRRRALKKLLSIFEVDTLSSCDVDALFEVVGPSLFLAMGNSDEKCRELSLKLIIRLFGFVKDFSPHLAHFFSTLIARYPDHIGYDSEQNIFLHNTEDHDEYLRGKAVSRQDHDSSLSHRIVEGSEEIRLLHLQSLSSLLLRINHLGSHSLLYPYFHELILMLLFPLRDPSPEIKVEGCGVLEFLTSLLPYETGLVHYAIGIAREALPLLRHRLSKVRLAAVKLLRRAVQVPHRDKCKGAGTEAIFDMVGFREENVLPIGAFYDTGQGMTINYLADIIGDPNTSVRIELAQLLKDWVTLLPDRYDFFSRLLPYILDLFSDQVEEVQEIAMCAIEECGREYEREHMDEVRERRQYGVDGDLRIDYETPLPPPFPTQGRPRIGQRLFVRGYAGRFLKSLLNELTNWISSTRLKSAQLLRTLTIFCEEHVTTDIHKILPKYVEAIATSMKEEEEEVVHVMLEICELNGRFIPPDSYLPFFYPLLNQDMEVVSMQGMDEERKMALLKMLGCFLRGTMVTNLLPHITPLFSNLLCLCPKNVNLRCLVLRVVVQVLGQLRGKGKEVFEGHFVATGRLSSISTLIQSTFQRLLLDCEWFHRQTIIAQNNCCEGSSHMLPKERRDEMKLVGLDILSGMVYLISLENERFPSPNNKCDITKEEEVVEEIKSSECHQETVFEAWVQYLKEELDEMIVHSNSFSPSIYHILHKNQEMFVSLLYSKYHNTLQDQVENEYKLDVIGCLDVVSLLNHPSHYLVCHLINVFSGCDSSHSSDMLNSILPSFSNMISDISTSSNSEIQFGYLQEAFSLLIFALDRSGDQIDQINNENNDENVFEDLLSFLIQDSHLHLMLENHQGKNDHISGSSSLNLSLVYQSDYLKTYQKLSSLSDDTIPSPHSLFVHLIFKLVQKHKKTRNSSMDHELASKIIHFCNTHLSAEMLSEVQDRLCVCHILDLVATIQDQNEDVSSPSFQWLFQESLVCLLKGVNDCRSEMRSLSLDVICNLLSIQSTTSSSSSSLLEDGCIKLLVKDWVDLFLIPFITNHLPKQTNFDQEEEEEYDSEEMIWEDTSDFSKVDMALRIFLSNLSLDGKIEVSKWFDATRSDWSQELRKNHKDENKSQQIINEHHIGFLDGLMDHLQLLLTIQFSKTTT